MSGAGTALAASCASCHACACLSRLPDPHAHGARCPRCGAELHARKPRSLERTWAYVLAAALCYVPANAFPVMTVTSLKGLEEVRLGNIFAPPLEITFEPWVKAWSYACTGLYCEGLQVGFWKSVYITVPSVIVSIAVGAVNGYALANWRFNSFSVS